MSKFTHFTLTLWTHHSLFFLPLFLSLSFCRVLHDDTDAESLSLFASQTILSSLTHFHHRPPITVQLKTINCHCYDCCRACLCVLCHSHPPRPLLYHTSVTFWVKVQHFLFIFSFLFFCLLSFIFLFFLSVLSFQRSPPFHLTLALSLTVLFHCDHLQSDAFIFLFTLLPSVSMSTCASFARSLLSYCLPNGECVRVQVWFFILHKQCKVTKKTKRYNSLTVQHNCTCGVVLVILDIWLSFFLSFTGSHCSRSFSFLFPHPHPPCKPGSSCVRVWMHADECVAVCNSRTHIYTRIHIHILIHCYCFTHTHAHSWVLKIHIHHQSEQQLQLKWTKSN